MISEDRVVTEMPFLSPGATAYGGAFFGKGTGPVYLNSVTCVGTETRLSDCPNPGVNMIGTCSGHSEDAGLRCSEGTCHGPFSLPTLSI